MKIRLKEDLFYSKITDLVCMSDDADADDHEFLFDVINKFMDYGKIIHANGNLDLYMKADDVIELKEPTYQGPDYLCNYHGLLLDLSTDGELEVEI